MPVERIGLFLLLRGSKHSSKCSSGNQL